MFTKLFWMDAAERAIATFAQTLLALVAVLAPMSGMDLLDINYGPLLLVSLIAAGLSVVKSIAAAAKANTDTASLVVDTKPLTTKPEVK